MSKRKSEKVSEKVAGKKAVPPVPSAMEEDTTACKTPDAKMRPVDPPISGVRSPSSKKSKEEEPEEKPKKDRDTWKLITVKGGGICLVYLNSKICSQSDGFAPYTFALGQYADGEYKKYDMGGNLLKEFKCDTLLTMGCVGSFVRRGSGGPYSNSLMNKQMGKGAKAYGRKCLLFFLEENINALDEVARKKFKFKLLYEILALTNKLNTKMNPGNRGNDYKICLEDDPPIDKQKSLDSYLKDRDVISVMQSYCVKLDGSWVQNNPESAKVFFDKQRSTYPETANTFGYVNVLSKFNDPDEEEKEEDKDDDAYLQYV
jgi:hypothetical protein